MSLKVSDLNHNVRKLCPKEESKNCFKNTQSVKIADSDMTRTTYRRRPTTLSNSFLFNKTSQRCFSVTIKPEVFPILYLCLQPYMQILTYKAKFLHLILNLYQGHNKNAKA